MPKLPKGYLAMGRDEYAAYDSDTLRAVYVELREIVRYTMGNGPADSAIRAQKPSAMIRMVKPVDWVMAIRRVECKCERCNGSGTYSWGACINGRMSHSASCARCGGKGRMDFDDMRRGRAYDRVAVAWAAR